MNIVFNIKQFQRIRVANHWSLCAFPRPQPLSWLKEAERCENLE